MDSEEEHKIERMEQGEITNLAREIVTNQVYFCDGEDIGERFPVLLLADWMTEEYAQSIGGAWKYRHKASPWGINGKPMFFSCRVIHRDDLAFLYTEINRLAVALQ